MFIAKPVLCYLLDIAFKLAFLQRFS